MLARSSGTSGARRPGSTLPSGRRVSSSIVLRISQKQRSSAGRTTASGGSDMKDLAGRIAVITGGGTGMGRELARQLVAEGCNIAMCDVSAAAMAETKRLCEVDRLPQGLRITTHVADVSDEDQVKRFADEVGQAAGHRQDPPAVQQCRHRRRRQHDRARARRMGAHLQHLLVRRLLQHARLPADAAQGRPRPHRQHLERQRLLGLRSARPSRTPPTAPPSSR